MLGHHRPAIKWRFARGPMMAHFSDIWILSPLIKLKKKIKRKKWTSSEKTFWSEEILTGRSVLKFVPCHDVICLPMPFFFIFLFLSCLAVSLHSTSTEPDGLMVLFFLKSRCSRRLNWQWFWFKRFTRQSYGFKSHPTDWGAVEITHKPLGTRWVVCPLHHGG